MSMSMIPPHPETLVHADVTSSSSMEVLIVGGALVVVLPCLTRSSPRWYRYALIFVRPDEQEVKMSELTACAIHSCILWTHRIFCDFLLDALCESGITLEEWNQAAAANDCELSRSVPWLSDSGADEFEAASCE